MLFFDWPNNFTISLLTMREQIVLSTPSARMLVDSLLEEIAGEEWREIEHFVPNRQVRTCFISNLGRIKKVFAGGQIRISSGTTGGNGYRNTRCNGMVYIHRLVARYFIPNPLELATVDHYDHDIQNNRVSNLRWLSQHQQNLWRRVISRGGVYKLQGKRIKRWRTCWSISGVQTFTDFASRAAAVNHLNEWRIPLMDTPSKEEHRRRFADVLTDITNMIWATQDDEEYEDDEPRSMEYCSKCDSLSFSSDVLGYCDYHHCLKTVCTDCDGVLNESGDFFCSLECIAESGTKPEETQ